jgi:hypothetical protein
VCLQAHARTVDLPRLRLVVKDKCQHAAVRHAVRQYARLLQQLPSCPPALSLVLYPTANSGGNEAAYLTRCGLPDTLPSLHLCRRMSVRRAAAGQCVLQQAPGSGKRNLATKAVEVALSKPALFLAEQHALPIGDQNELHKNLSLAS